jgi:hypothetical protein
MVMGKEGVDIDIDLEIFRVGESTLREGEAIPTIRVTRQEERERVRKT